jgi:hypothetical protein
MFNPALAAALVVAAAPGPKLSTAEQQYIEARDAATARFSKRDVPDKAERQAMDHLRGLLRQIVGPVRLPDLAGPGELAYEGFWGVGSTPGVADGLWFNWKSNTLFVTTRPLFVRAVGTEPPRDARSVEDIMISRTVLAGHAAFTTFADLPVRMGVATKRGRAVVGVVAQADGPWPPNHLIVQMERGERVFVVAASLEPPMEQVEDCKSKFNADLQKIPNGSDNLDQLQDRVYDSYRRCIGSTLASRPSYAAVLGRAQAIVDQLEAGEGAEPPTPR